MRTTAGFISRGRFVQPKLRDKRSEEGTGDEPTSPKPRDCDRSFLAIGCKLNGVISHDADYIRLCRLRASECCKQMAHQPKLTQFEQVSGRSTGNVTKQQIKEDIKRVESIVGRSPTTRQYKKWGKYSRGVYTDRFGSWNEAKKAVGLEPNRGRGQISKEELIKDIRIVAEQLGRPPTTAEHIEHGEYSETAKRNRFGTHQNAIEAAGFDYDDVPKTGRANKQISKQDIIDELQRVAEIEGAPPVARSDNVRISSTTICRKFGTWSNALEEAGLDSRNGGTAKKVAFSDVVDVIIDVAVETDRPPFEDEVTGELDHTRATTDIAGSWSETLKMAGFPPRRRGGLLGCDLADSVSNYGSNWDKQKKKARQRDRQQCVDCGKQRKDIDSHTGPLEVHHIKPIRTFDEPEDGNVLENLITLCPECHNKWESVTQYAFEQSRGQSDE